MFLVLRCRLCMIRLPVNRGGEAAGRGDDYQSAIPTDRRCALHRQQIRHGDVIDLQLYIMFRSRSPLTPRRPSTGTCTCIAYTIDAMGLVSCYLEVQLCTLE